MSDKLQADYLFPCGGREPMERGIVVIDSGGYVLEVVPDGTYSDVTKYEGIICPGFINAHCHLELSIFRNKIPKHTGLTKFVSYMKMRDTFGKKEVKAAMLSAQREMYNNGIVGVGDVANTSESFNLKKRDLLYYHTFVEFFGINPDVAADRFRKAEAIFSKLADYPRCKGSLAAHAPYTSSIEQLILIKIFNRYHYPKFTSIHHQESRAENDLFMSGTGEWAEMYEQMGVALKHFFRPLGTTSLSFVWAYLAREAKVLMVHNTVCNQEDVDFIMSEGADVYWCFCPNANLYIENKLPNFTYFYPYSDRVCLGTDSLASNDQLSILEEMKTIHQHYPNLPLATLLEWGTHNGAVFFEWDAFLGSIAPDKQPGICLIEDLDLNTMRLLPQSKVRLLRDVC